MARLLLLSGNGAAILGVLICALAGLFRLSGNHYLPGGVEAFSAFTFGTGLMVFACLAKLELLYCRCLPGTDGVDS
ncbi:hypothetical protein DV711_04700 [Motiliproteus coralliicola]|uniref:Uncharacterized protein n=1 Tax=Motiliproteus coralliicola TaxID=2283196 RepID=A0A369WWG7_9GAMM|nr:hypothetical protein [Motiliproteus coralliicola]RDE24886.1 hypothetical protein DV711_04700 [Motiliproteus coralliicola]